MTDFGKAILIAVARVFANCIDLNHYLQICYKVINDNCTNIPSCYMRLDVSHFIAMIARWDCLKNKATKIRQFFIRSLGRIYQTYNFNDTRIFFKSLLVVALSEELGLDNDGMKLPSEMYLMEINSIIKGVTIEDPNEHDNHECVEDDEIAAKDCWNTWAENIYFEAQEVADVSVNGTMANAYYNVEAAQKIKHLMCYLPLWTCIMRSHFKNGLQIATSSYVEAEFAELKTRNFKNQLPMRIDKFIFRHIEYLDSRLKVTCGSANQMADTKETESSPLKTFNNDTLINSSPKDNMELTHERELSSVKMLNESSLIKSKDNTDSIETEFSPVKTPSEDNATKLIEDMDLIEKEWSLVKISDEEDNVVKSPSKDDNENNNESSLLNVFNKRNVTKSHFKHNDVNKSFMNTDEENLEQKSLNEIENWRGKIKRKTSANDETRISKRSKSNYLAPCADWDFSNTNKTIGLPILKNGSLCKATTVKKKQIILSETCSFDSIFQVVANGIGMHSTYKTNMNALILSNDFVKFTMDILISGKITAKDYNTRAMILYDIPLFEKKCTRNITSLNANCNAAHLIEYLFNIIPSYTTRYSCCKCGHSYERTSPTYNINVDEILQNGLSNIQQAIDDEIICRRKTTCHKCKSTVSRTMSYGPHIIIDTSIITDEGYIKEKRIQQKYMLNDVSKTITIENNNYSLAGLVSYNRYSRKLNDEHYVAFTYTGLCWYKFNDLPAKRVTVSANEEIRPHVLLYVKT